MKETVSGAVTTSSQPVLCRDTQKFLAKVDGSGINLWCKECKRYHTVSWELLQQSLQDIEEHRPLSVIRTA